MKIIIIGMPYFSDMIAQKIQKYDIKNQYKFINVSLGLKYKIEYIKSLMKADLVYAIGGTPVPGFSLKMALILKKKIVMHWVGSDVINAKKAVLNSKNYSKLLLREAVHLCECDWIKEELDEISICAEIIQIASFSENKNIPKAFPKYFNILSYVGEGREEFYGLHKIVEVAKNRPHYNFKIVGINKSNYKIPENMELLGWVKNMDVQYEESVVYIRLAEHDGLAFTVLEALNHGRYVGYTYQVKGVEKISTIIQIEAFLDNLYDRYKNGNLIINKTGSDYIQENFMEKEIMNKLINKLDNA